MPERWNVCVPCAEMSLPGGFCAPNPPHPQTLRHSSKPGRSVQRGHLCLLYRWVPKFLQTCPRALPVNYLVQGGLWSQLQSQWCHGAAPGQDVLETPLTMGRRVRGVQVYLPLHLSHTRGQPALQPPKPS